METLRAKHSFAAARKCLRYSYVRFNRRQETRPFRLEIKEWLGRLEQTHEAYEDASLERMSLTAEVVFQNERLNGTMISLSNQVAGASPESRRSLLWKAVFPAQPPSQGMAGLATPEKEAFIKDVLRRLEAPKYQAFQAQKQAIQSAFLLLTETLEIRKKAEDTERAAKEAYAAVKTEVQAAYNRLYPRLQADFDFPKSLLESFFLSISSKAHEKEEA